MFGARQTGEEAPSDLLSSLKTVILQIKADLEQAQEAQKQERLARWKSRLNDASLKGLGRWIRAKETSAQALVLTQSGQPLQRRTDATQAICSFWSQVWSESSVPHQQVGHKLAQDFLRQNHDVAGFRWEPVKFEDLWQATRNTHGSGGPDQWEGEEVKHLPVPAIRLFYVLTTKWELAEALPQQLQESKQVSIPKQAKAINGCLDVGNVRPVSVMSIFWRLYATAFTKAAITRRWCQQFLHDDIAHGLGAKGAENMAEDIQRALISDGVLASLDWAQAYDRMAPEATITALRELPFPESFVALLEKAWSQKRWVSYQGHVHETPLVAHCATSPRLSGGANGAGAVGFQWH